MAQSTLRSDVEVLNVPRPQASLTTDPASTFKSAPYDGHIAMIQHVHGEGRPNAGRDEPVLPAFDDNPHVPRAAFSGDPMGVIGKDLPREVVRVQRDWSGGEIIQFQSLFPPEFEARVSVISAVPETVV